MIIVKVYFIQLMSLFLLCRNFLVLLYAFQFTNIPEGHVAYKCMFTPLRIIIKSIMAIPLFIKHRICSDYNIDITR